MSTYMVLIALMTVHNHSARSELRGKLCYEFYVVEDNAAIKK